MEGDNALLKCTCGENEEKVLFEDNGEMDSGPKQNDLVDRLTLPTSNSKEKSDVDTDSLESCSVSSSLQPTDGKEHTSHVTSDSLLQNGSGEIEPLPIIETLKSISGSSFTDSCSSQVSVESKTDEHKSINTDSAMKNKPTAKTTAKSGKKSQTPNSSVKSAKTSNLSKLKDINKPISQKDRRMSESCIVQTSSESHGIRETRLSRKRFERCHENHASVDCEGEDYLTPTQRKDNLLKNLKREVKDLKKMLCDKTHELETERENFDKKLEILLAEKDTEMIILKSDMETLEKKNEDLQKSHQVSLNTINMLEENIRELKESIAERERNNERVFLETYRKGQMSALFERNEELERIAVKCDGSSITIKELLQKLMVTETELGKWQSIRRQESYDSAQKPETESDAILRFLKDSFYHYATDDKDADFHLRAMIRILNFTDVQKKKIAESIVAKRKHKTPI